MGAGDDVELRGVVPAFGARAVLALGGEDWRTGLRAQGGQVRRGLQGTSPPPGHRPPSPAGELGAPGAESPQSRAPHRASQEPAKPHAPKPSVHPAPLPAARQGSPGTQRSGEHTHPWALGGKKRNEGQTVLPEPTWTQSQRTGLGASAGQNLSPQAGATSAPPPHPPIPPSHRCPAPARLPGLDLLHPPPRPTYHTSRRGSTSQGPFCSSPRSPVGTEGGSPCTG